jgi:hypothetical protein
LRLKSPLQSQIATVSAAAVVWLGFISLCYLRATGPFLRQILQQTGGIFALLGLVGLGFAGLVGWVRRDRLSAAYLIALFGGFLAACIALVTLGGNILAFTAVAWIFLVAWLQGDLILGLLLRSSGPQGSLRGLLATLLGCGLLSHLMLALALTGWLHRWLIVALLLLGTVPAWRYRSALKGGPRLLRQSLNLLADTSLHWLVLPLATILTGWCLIVLIQALAPETQYDAVVYHLGLPKLYIEQGRYVATPFSMQSWFYLGADMNFLLGMIVAGQTAAKLVQTGFLVLGLALVYTFGGQALSRRAGLLACFLLLTTP